MHTAKTGKPHSPFLPLALSLLVGAACVLSMREAYLRLASPRLFLALKILDGDGGRRLAICFMNAGAGPLTLDFSGVEYFVYIPDPGKREFFVHIRRPAGHSDPPPGGGGTGKPTVLQPGEEFLAGDLTPLLRNLPPGGGVLRAVYTSEGTGAGVWRGVAVSLPIALQSAKN